MALPSSTTSLVGVLERIIFFNEENHYTIAELRPETGAAPAPGASTGAAPPAGDKSTVTITGALPGVQCGETLRLTGEWTRHAQHGAQFKVATFKSELPSSVYGIRKYLGSGLVHGIGQVYANKIVDAFGTDTFRILSEESGKLRQVPGIGKVRATSIKAAWDEQRTLREVHIFLQTYGVTTAQCVRIVKQWDATAQRVIQAEPYRLAREIDGIGFKTADRLAINLGFANDAAPRLDAGLIYALQTLEEEGHTAFPRGELIAHTANLLETSAERVEARIDALIAAKELVQHLPQTTDHRPPTIDPRARPPDAKPALRSPNNPQPITHNWQLDAAVVQLPHHDRAERQIAAAVQRLRAVPSGLPAIKIPAALQWAQDKAGFDFHPLQSAALHHALAHKLSILTGGPGTGKTTILRALVEILKAKKVRLTLAAPTGRAAQRLTETTGGFASTIHRLLGFDPARGGFLHNDARPLATDFLIVDEASMLDTRLAAALLSAVPVRAHLLLVGDVDQLPSVGAGNVLKDLIAVSSTANLQSSTSNAQRGRANPPDEPSRWVQGSEPLEGPRLVGTTRPTSPPTAHRQASGSSAPAVPKLDKSGPVHGAFDIRHSSSVIPVTRLSFVYRQGKESAIVTTAHAINEGVASPPPVVPEVGQAQAWSDLNFIAADGAEDCLTKVVALYTQFIPRQLHGFHPVTDVQVLAPMHKGVAGVANLNLRLQAALQPFKTAPLPAGAARPALKTVSGTYEAGDKLIQLRNNYDKNLFNGDIGTVLSVDAAAGTLVADFDGARHTFERGEFGDVGLAFAVSIHKSQGSEYPVVIIPLLKGHFMMLQRNLLYTAITRGRKKVFVVGEPAAWGMAVRNAEAKQRCTHLREKLLAGAD